MLRLTVRNDLDKDIVAYVYSMTYQSGGKTVHDSIFQMSACWTRLRA